MFRFLTLLLFSFVALTLHSQSRDTLHFHSDTIKNGDYTVEVILPPGYDSTKAYPICYFLDLMLADPLMKDISDSLQRNGLVSDYIFVGIRCDDTVKWSFRQRVQDFTPSYRADQDARLGYRDISTHISGGGPLFLSFLKTEIIPQVEKKYKGIPMQRTLFGMSLSGLFAAYVLAEDPALFGQYIIGAPSLWYNDREVVKRLSEMKAKKLKTVRKVYMGIGDKETAAMLKIFEEFTTLLKEKNVPVVSEIYAGKDHTGIWSMFLVKGIQQMFPVSNPR